MLMKRAMLLQLIILELVFGRIAVSRAKSVRYPPIENILRTLNANVKLNPAERVFVPMQLRGTMLYEGSLKDSGIQCQASTILHEELRLLPNRSDVFWIPHSRIVVDGQRCGTGRAEEYMIIVPGRDLAKRAVAEERGLARVYAELLSNARGMHVFMMLHAIDKVFLGFEISAHRHCGGRVVYSRGTTFVFVSSSTSKLNIGFAVFRKRQVAMVAVLNNQNMCAYQDDFADNNLAVPSPSVTPSIPVTPAPSGAFQLKIPNLAEIESPSPTPSKIVKPSISPRSITDGGATTSPSTSPSPEGSITARSSQQPKMCFPNGSLVQLFNGSVIFMSSLQVGDRVRTGKDSYSAVFMFTHKSTIELSEFVVLATSSGHTIELSGGHYIETDGVMKTARNVQVGDTLRLENQQISSVIHIEKAMRKGLHNPQTLDGNIVVNGIVASTFTEAITGPTALSVLTPIRAVYRMGIWSKPFYGTFWNSDRGLLHFFRLHWCGNGNRFFVPDVSLIYKSQG